MADRAKVIFKDGESWKGPLPFKVGFKAESPIYTVRVEEEEPDTIRVNLDEELDVSADPRSSREMARQILDRIKTIKVFAEIFAKGTADADDPGLRRKLARAALNIDVACAAFAEPND